MSGSSVAAVASAVQTIYPVMVNGYLCFSAAEAVVARSGGNPDPTAQGTAVAAARPTQTVRPAQTVRPTVTAATATATAAAETVRPAYTATARTATAATRGTVVDIYA